MDKWKIAFICLQLLHLSVLIHTETKITIPGEDLEGPNVCKRILTHNVTVVVSEMVPYKEYKTEWCAQFPPRCRKEVIKLRQENKTEVFEKTQAIRECCDGYKENEQRNRCIPHCQKSCGFGKCTAPNVCKCNSGYGGPSCNITCPPGLYGTKCKKKCDCTNGAECNPYDGSCECKIGYQGAKCENTCTPDRYGEGCQEVCRCENGGKCNHISGECYCQKGYTGPLCQEKCKSGKNGDECKSICRCQNGGICDEDSQTCKCPPGWEGSVCGNRCQPGTYGLNCSHVCECFNGASCDHVTGKCECEPGFMGDKCLDQCPFNKFGVNCTHECTCTNGATCDKGSGKCHCVPGWAGDDCSERQCPDDMYGESCNETCECEKDNTVSCHPHDGACDCKEGWTGVTCNRPCPFLKYGKSCAYQCDCKNNAQCQPIDGKCICTPGYTGDKCELPCPEGTYGQDCSQRCECKNDAKCSPETGECFCKPGWQGLKCERPCEVNSYGQGCSKKCDCLNNGTCNPVTGECFCAVGWMGKNCEEKCKAGFFGQNCSFECICEPQNTLACDHQTGRCTCRTELRGSQLIKYAGVKCESTCPLGYYGAECHHQCNCKNNSSCDPVTGECFCERGWIGKHCDQKCPTGYFGQHCKERCPENMPPKTTCDHVTGEFKCRPGYIGLTCDHACKSGTYGEDCKQDCKCEHGECHHVDGVCRCFAGWWGDLCEKPCPEDTWGSNCQHKCQCSNSAQCRKTDGNCVCKAGFMGPKCEEVCPEGYFGDNCLNVCSCNRKPNFVCHPAHGCLCKNGWRGKNCDESIFASSTAEEDEFYTTSDTFASMNYDEILTTKINQESSNQSSTIDSTTKIELPKIFENTNETTTSTPMTSLGPIIFPQTTKFTFSPLRTTFDVNSSGLATSSYDSTTKFTFAPLQSTTTATSTDPIVLKFSPIESTTHGIPHDNRNEIFSTQKISTSSMSANVTMESSVTRAVESMTTINYVNYTTGNDFVTENSLENVITTPIYGNDTSASENTFNSQNNRTESVESQDDFENKIFPDELDQNGSSRSNDSKSHKNDDSNEFGDTKSNKIGSNENSLEQNDHETKMQDEMSTTTVMTSTDTENLNNRKDKSMKNRNFSANSSHTDSLWTNMTKSINSGESNQNKIEHSIAEHFSESVEGIEDEGSSVNRSGIYVGIMCTFIFLGIILTVLLYHRRKVAKLKQDIVHMVRYVSDDPNRNFDNPVYSYQQSVNTDTSTLLHRNGVMNNLRQTRPSNMDRLNNFDHDSNSSGRAAQYSLQYDAELMNQKNRDADQTNPNFYSSIDDHLYDEIKLKCADLDMEYDHLDYSRPQQPIVPHYHRATSSTMSTLSQRNRESDESNNNGFPVSLNDSSSTYDAPIPHPKKLNISCPLPPLPAKNNVCSNLTPSPSSSTGSNITQDDNIDAIIKVDKPMNKDLNSKPDVIESTD